MEVNYFDYYKKMKFLLHERTYVLSLAVEFAFCFVLEALDSSVRAIYLALARNLLLYISLHRYPVGIVNDCNIYAAFGINYS